MDEMKAREELRKLITKMYEETGAEVDPTFPRVLVRLLPKEQQTMSGLWLPDQQQNKPTAEGVVLKTYKPFTLSRGMARSKSAIELLDKPVEIKPSVGPGDHVLFSHYEGIPVPRLDGGRGDYRLVDEFAFQAIVRCERKPVKDWLVELFGHLLEDSVDEVYLKDTIDKFLTEADVIRHETAKTLSGV